MKFRMWHGCDRGLCCKAAGRQDRQLNTYDWLADVPGNAESTDLVEVQFKNTRKGYYHNVNNLDLKKGDVVAVDYSADMAAQQAGGSEESSPFAPKHPGQKKKEGQK